jgi:hypothetical protein
MAEPLFWRVSYAFSAFVSLVDAARARLGWSVATTSSGTVMPLSHLSLPSTCCPRCQSTRHPPPACTGSPANRYCVMCDAVSKARATCRVAGATQCMLSYVRSVRVQRRRRRAGRWMVLLAPPCGCGAVAAGVRLLNYVSAFVLRRRRLHTTLLAHTHHWFHVVCPPNRVPDLGLSSPHRRRLPCNRAHPPRRRAPPAVGRPHRAGGGAVVRRSRHHGGV